MKNRPNAAPSARFSPVTLTVRGRQVLALARVLPAVAVLAGSSPALAAPVITISPDARTAQVPFAGDGDGLCVQLAAAASSGTVTNAALANALLQQTPGAPAQAAPAGVNNGITNFFGLAPLLDYTNDAEGSAGGFAYDVLFPWSRSTGGEICQSHQPAAAVVRSAFAARYAGLLNVRTAGTKTFAVASDDGYQLRIGGATVAELQGARTAALDTRRASFAQAGVYPFELTFWSTGGAALLEIAMAEAGVVFVANDRTAPDPTGLLGSDLNNAAVGPFAGDLGFRVLGDGRADRGLLFVADADKIASRCGPALGTPSDVCALNDVSRLCGNGIVDARTGGAAESCDDGNEASGDGCSASCQVELGYLCAGSPSTCSVDIGSGGAAGAAGSGTSGEAGAAGASAGASGTDAGGAAGEGGTGGVAGEAGNGGAAGSEAAGAGGEAGASAGQSGAAGASIGGAGGLAGMNGAGAAGASAGTGGSIAGGNAGAGGASTAGNGGAGGAITAGSAGAGGSIAAGAGGSITAGNGGASGSMAAGNAGAGGAIAAGNGGSSGAMASAGTGGKAGGTAGIGGRAGAGAGGAAVAGRGGAGAGGGNAATASTDEGGCALAGAAGSGSRPGAMAALVLGAVAMLRRRRRG